MSRDPLELLITASGRRKEALTPKNFVHVDERGEPLLPDQPKASAETRLHFGLAQLPDVGAVLHTHSVWATILSDYYSTQGGFSIEGFEMLKGLGGVLTHEHAEWVPIFENSQNIRGLGEQIRDTLFADREAKVHGYLLRKHGLYTWGRDLNEAARHVEIFEFLFECIGRELMLSRST